LQNLTNWIWFSPWWLQYADYLWMLAGDDGMNGNAPELSEKAMFTTDRDTYIWRMFGNPADRPLVPVSRLMTHGILQTSAREKDIALYDWTDYVLMHYSRGTLLKEWYISLDAMRPDLWQALAAVQKWAKQHEAQLNNSVFVGGRPDEGNTYGYMGWLGNKAVLTARNPSPQTKKLIIPFNKITGFYGTPNLSYKAQITYPYHANYPATFTSGKDIAIEIPGYTTMAFEFEDGRAETEKENNHEKIDFTTGQNSTIVSIPQQAMTRCELMLIGYPDLPTITINGQQVSPVKTSKAIINNFASYAVSGMPSTQKPHNWNMVAYNLLPFTGKKIEIAYNGSKNFESYILADLKIQSGNNQKTILITEATKRETIRLK